MTDTVHLDRIRDVRRQLAQDGPPQVRPYEDDFSRVTIPEHNADAIRDLLIGANVTSVVEIGLAYAGSALAIGEALVAVGADRPRHLILDPFQDEEFGDAGWQLIQAAGLDQVATLLRERSQFALARLVQDGVSVDAAFVDGSHIFHHVFVDLYYLRLLVRPGGLVILDDHWWPSVAAAARYYETNLGWSPVAIDHGTVDETTGQQRMRALRLPAETIDPSFKAFQPF